MGQRPEAERLLDARAAELDRRDAALTCREEALDQRMEAAHELLLAADRRDTVADARDAGADSRERQNDRAEFLATEDSDRDTYGKHLLQRRRAALDREHAKSNRTASLDDRIALTEEPDETT